MRKARNLTRRSTALRVALVVCALGVCVVASWYFMSTLSGSAPSSKDGSAASESEGTRRAVLAGVHVFKGAAPLQYTLNDVEDMGDVLRERCRFTEIAELAKKSGDSNGAPTKKEILGAIAKVAKEAKKNDFIFIMLSGHGYRYPIDGKLALYFAPGDAVKDDAETMIALTDVVNLLQGSAAAYKFVLFDACQTKANGESGLPYEESEAKDVFVLESCSSGQASYEDRDSGHGCYVGHFIESLKERAADDNRDGKISLWEAHNYAAEKVACQHNGQMPHLVDAANKQDRCMELMLAELGPTAWEAWKPFGALLVVWISSVFVWFAVSPIADERKKRRLQGAEDGWDVDWNDAPAPGTRKTIVVAGVRYAFRYCLPGTFEIGSPESEKGRCVDEKLQTVTLTKGYWLLETPTTIEMFRSFVEARGYHMGSGYKGRGGWGYDEKTRQFNFDAKFTWDYPGFEQTDAHPATGVDWYGAAAFCDWLAKETGLPVRLPTEAEWERGCRAETTTAFSFGDDPSAITSYANVGDKSYNDFFGRAAKFVGDDGYVFTSPVRTFASNPWGLYDMHGNVWEWCADCYVAERSDEISDGKGDGVLRTLKGGSWSEIPKSCRSAKRYHQKPSARYCYIGFRVAIEGGEAAPTDVAEGK